MAQKTQLRLMAKWFKQVYLNSLILAIEASAALEAAARKLSGYLEDRKALLERNVGNNNKTS